MKNLILVIPAKKEEGSLPIVFNEIRDYCLCVELPVKMKRMNAIYTDTPSHERERIHGIKKVREFSDGLKILFGMVKLFFKIK